MRRDRIELNHQPGKDRGDKNYLPAGERDQTEITGMRYQLQDEIIRNVKNGNEYHALQALEKRNLIGLTIRLEDEFTEWKVEAIALEAVLRQALREERVPELFLDNLYTKYVAAIVKIKNAEECRELMRNMVSTYCRSRDYQSLQSNSVLVQKILLAVEQDLTQPLTLQFFAERLNVNGSYLSDLFHRETGETITEYVTKKRIQHAMILLEESRYPIKTVAEQVGIPDVHYFSKLFKRRMGETPSQYRESRCFYTGDSRL